MNARKVNDWLTLVANVSVVAGIFFLAFEIRQNSEAVRLNTAQSMGAEQAEFNRGFVTGEIAEIFVQMRESGYDSLTPVQQLQLVGFDNTYLFVQQNLYYQYRAGSLDEKLWAARHRAIVSAFREGNLARHWKNRSFAFDEDFQEYINQVVLPEASSE